MKPWNHLLTPVECEHELSRLSCSALSFASLDNWFLFTLAAQQLSRVTSGDFFSIAFNFNPSIYGNVELRNLYFFLWISWIYCKYLVSGITYWILCKHRSKQTKQRTSQSRFFISGSIFLSILWYSNPQFTILYRWVCEPSDSNALNKVIVEIKTSLSINFDYETKKYLHKCVIYDLLTKSISFSKP